MLKHEVMDSILDILSINYASRDAIYLGLGRRYEAGICTIVISMNGAFQ